MESLYEHAGGRENLRHFIDVFYGSVLADPLLQPLFGAGRPDHVDHLTEFEAESFGGPDDQPFHEALRSHVEFGSHVAMQNSHAQTDDQLHPLREVPKWQWPENTGGQA